MTSGTLPLVEALSWTLLHFLWQGSLAALFLAAFYAAINPRSANLRYLAGCAAMALMLALPVMTFVALYQSPVEAGISANTPPASRASIDSATDNPLPAGLITRAAQAANLRTLFTPFAPWLTLLWFAGVIALSLRTLAGWLYVRRLTNCLTGTLSLEWQRRFAQLCRELRILRPVRLLESALVQVPTVIGWLRPVVLIPASALMGLTPRQLEAVIAHELAHIRRYDYLINLLQTAVEILLFYHPAVWSVSRRVRAEREHCCDDLAVAACGDALVYARALAEIEALRKVSPQLAMAADGGSLLARIQRIVGHLPQRSDHTISGIAGALVLAIVVFVGAAGQFSSADGASNQSAIPDTIPLTAGRETPSAPPQRGMPDGEKSADQPAPSRSRFAEADSGTNSPAEVTQAPEPPQAEKAGSFIGELAALGYTNLTMDDLISLKNHGVTPQLIRELKEHGYDKLAVRELTRLASAGITGQFLKELKSAGVGQLPLESLLRLQAHAVNPAFVKELDALGYKGLSADQLTKVASHGVKPDFIRALQAAGYKDVPIAEVIRAYDHGVRPDFIKEIRSLGYETLELNQVVRMKDHGVDAEFIRGMEAAGFRRLPPDEIIRARDHGVTPEYIESLRKAGYDKVPIDELIRMRNHGIDAAFIQRAKSNGFPNISIDQLIRLRNAGVLD